MRKKPGDLRTIYMSKSVFNTHITHITHITHAQYIYLTENVIIFILGRFDLYLNRISTQSMHGVRFLGEF